jgi:hypothetical protein
MSVLETPKHLGQDGERAPSPTYVLSNKTYLAFTGMAHEKSVRVNPANIGSIGTLPSPNEMGLV